MKKYGSQRSSLLLMEIIIAILFFSIVGAVCLQLFVKSHNITKETRILDRAVNEISSCASVVRNAEDITESLRALYPDITGTDESLTVYFDRDFKVCKKTDHVYYMEINSKKSDDSYTVCQLSYYTAQSEEPKYALSVDCYRPAKR